MSPDVVVVGAGLAGLTAGVRLAQAGLRTTLVAKGPGATHLAPPTIDVLGYAPDLVERPAAALASFVAERPDHPYARLPADTVAASAEWLRGLVPSLAYVGTIEENLLLPTAVGVPKPSAFVPEAMAAGDLRSGGRFAFAGLRALKDFYPRLLAENLSQAKLPTGVTVDARVVPVTDPGAEADVSPLGYARMFEDREFRSVVAGELLPKLEPGESVGFPSVLGLREHRTTWLDLQDRLGRPVFEVPTLPPSVAGIRLFNGLRDAFVRAGGRLLIGSTAAGAESKDDVVTHLVMQTAAARVTPIEATWFVLATGGFAEGALFLDSYGEVHESVFGLAVSGVPAAGEPRFVPRYFDDQPMARAGISVDERLRPLDLEGNVAFRNLFAAGSALGGAEPWRELSGNGLALASGFAVASAIVEGAS
jgi:glycerol-3-phosphate dehydrogenase subunit B